MQKDDLIFVKHILDSINAIEDFSAGLLKEEFISNRLKQSAITREVEIIGEATKNISEDFKANNKEIEWGNMSKTRDKVIHNYFGIDLNIIWEIVKKDLPELKKKLEKII